MSMEKIKETGIPLTLLPEGTQCRVVDIRAGKGLTRRLIELGFSEGIKVRVVKVQRHGPMIVMVRGSKLGLGKGMAMKVMVRRID